MSDTQSPYLPTAIPTPRQSQFQDWEFGLFLHFGIRTFFEGHRDWDGQVMSPVAFNPTQLDCDQWIATAHEAGMKYAVLVAKHHDGFANWPSQYTDCSVASSPWKDGKGDVVREFTDACRRHDMKVGLYYSPADASNKTYSDPRKYDDYFIRQISELLTNYGTIDLLWFDGCGSEGHEYDWQRIIGEIRRMQPGILIFNMGDPDYRWIGNEAGLAPLPCWNTVNAVPFSVQTEAMDATAGQRPTWLPAECDCRMRAANWFYSDSDESTVKSVEQLMGLYYYSVGRGTNLILNIGPDRRGLLPDTDTRRLLEFGAEIRRRFAHPLATIADGQATDSSWNYAPGHPFFVDHVIVQEDLTRGEHVRRFNIQAFPAAHNGPITVWEGQNIGHKAICRFPLVEASRIVVNITVSDGPARLREVSLHRVAP